MFLRILFAALIFSLWLPHATWGAEPSIENGTTVVSGLNTPWGIAVQPTTRDWFISESGAGRIVRVSSISTKKEPQPVITGFAVRDYGHQPTYRLGPLGLAFLDRDTLIVGGGELGLGADLVRMYKLSSASDPVAKDSKPSDAKGAPSNPNDAKNSEDKSPEAKPTTELKPFAKLGPIPPGEISKVGEGYFFSVAVNTGNLFALGQGDLSKGLILKADLINNKPGLLKQFITSKQANDPSGAFAMVLNKRNELVIGTCSESGKLHEATISFYNSRNGKLLLHLTTGLNDIVGLAYSPSSGRLYAIDLSKNEPKAAGLYRLDDDEKGGVKPFLITALDQPTSLSFLPDGNALLVTILGKYPADSKEPAGQVVKFTGL